MRKHKHIIAKVYEEPTGEIVHGATEEEKYVLTPKGCAFLAMFDAEIEPKDQAQFNLFWDKFQEYMKNAGYIKE